MRNRVFQVACGAAFLFLLPAHAAAAGKTYGYGDIKVTIVSEPLGEARHGYAVYTFKIDNTSKQKHTVTIALPRDEGSSGDNAIRSLRKTVEVGPNGTDVVSLFQPPAPGIYGSDGRVFIDGKAQDQELNLAIHIVNIREHAHLRHMKMSSGPIGGSSGNPPLVLVSPGVKQELLDVFLHRTFSVPAKKQRGPADEREDIDRMKPFDPRPIKEAGKPNVEMVSISLPLSGQRPTGSMRDWPRHWLGYSRYEGVILTRINLLEIPESDRHALWQYVETGGVLLVVGEGPVSDGWNALPAKDSPGFKAYRPGFGVCVVAPEQHAAWKEEVFVTAGQAWQQTGNPLAQIFSLYDSHRRFPVVEDVGIPVRGLFVLMFLFSLVIGPVNISLLSRWNRRIWLLWTVPLLSGITVLAVFGYMLVSEGWSRHLRIETITILDENTHRAATVGWTAFYSPVTPGDGLHFSYDTEVTQQGDAVEMDDMYYGRHGPRGGGGISRTCFIDLTNEQHFTRGWVSARVPSHFQVRKSERALQRVSIRKNIDGSYSIVANTLGAGIKKFWFADEQGRLHSAAEVEAGAGSKLSLTESRLETDKQGLSVRSLYEAEWLSSARNLRSTPGKYLRPLTYLAEVDGSPFLEEALKNSKDRKMSGLVLGIIKELEHEN